MHKTNDANDSVEVFEQEPVAALKGSYAANGKTPLNYLNQMTLTKIIELPG